MLLISLICLLLAIPLHSQALTMGMFTRLTGLAFFTSLALSFNAYSPYIVDSGLSIYSGNFQVTAVSVGIEELTFLLAGLFCLSYPTTTTSDYLAREMPLILVFTALGGVLLLSSTNLISLIISLELQSLAIYVLATLFKGPDEGTTFAGLMYFILGALASCLVLLGCAVIYTATGCLDYAQLQAFSYGIESPVTTMGLITVLIGLLFKVAAAPLHNWSIIVYDKLPTHLVTWIAVIPKVSILVLIAQFAAIDTILALMMIVAVLSIAVGSLLGLTQSRIKRLYAYSSVSHIGFLLLGIAASALQTGNITAFLLYLGQYSLTTMTLFLILVAIPMVGKTTPNSGIERISQLQGLYGLSPLLCVTLAICFFSMAGLPFLVGFFAKLEVLTSCLEGGYTITALIAILMSVVSAGYYLRVIQLSFDGVPITSVNISANMSEMAYVIAVVSLGLLTYMVNPELWMNLVYLMVLS